MRIGTLTLAALAWAALGLGGASAEKLLQNVREAPRPAAKEVAKAATTDPAEPPLSVEVSFGNEGNGQRLIREAGGRVQVLQGGRMGPGQAVSVVSGARGTVLTLNTPGAWQ